MRRKAAKNDDVRNARSNKYQLLNKEKNERSQIVQGMKRPADSAMARKVVVIAHCGIVAFCRTVVEQSTYN